VGVGLLGASLIAKAGAFAPRSAGVVSQPREDVNQPRHAHTHLSPSAQGRPQGQHFGSSFWPAVKLENAHEKFYGRCPFCQCGLDRDSRGTGDADCAARAESEPGGHSGLWRLRSWLASRPLWRLPTAVQLPSGMAHRTLRTALLPQLVNSRTGSIDVSTAASMTAVTAVTPVRPGAARGRADAQHGDRDGEHGEKLSHRNGPLIRLVVKERARPSTGFIPRVKLWESSRAITFR
jgi:hypothetical protein